MRERLAIWLTNVVMKMTRERGLTGPSLLDEMVKVDLITRKERADMMALFDSKVVIRVSVKAIYWMLKAHPKGSTK